MKKLIITLSIILCGINGYAQFSFNEKSLTLGKYQFRNVAYETDENGEFVKATYYIGQFWYTDVFITHFMVDGVEIRERIESEDAMLATGNNEYTRFNRYFKEVRKEIKEMGYNIITMYYTIGEYGKPTPFFMEELTKLQINIVLTNLVERGNN